MSFKIMRATYLEINDWEKEKGGKQSQRSIVLSTHACSAPIAFLSFFFTSFFLSLSFLFSSKQTLCTAVPKKIQLGSDKKELQKEKKKDWKKEKRVRGTEDKKCIYTWPTPPNLRIAFLFSFFSIIFLPFNKFKILLHSESSKQNHPHIKVKDVCLLTDYSSPLLLFFESISSLH
eukprot:TRINITY_DN3220_c0_g1_i1.p1 TRINITY_DN3220_c0_g1~~TRINITY_DN3220_c0_g1_i1.p1  ORF type:complete len:175 (+),score=39.42 TRINITY_DN3220_c0_g1_i1:1250-1774(+)